MLTIHECVTLIHVKCTLGLIESCQSPYILNMELYLIATLEGIELWCMYLYCTNLILASYCDVLCCHLCCVITYYVVHQCM